MEQIFQFWHKRLEKTGCQKELPGLEDTKTVEEKHINKSNEVNWNTKNFYRFHGTSSCSFVIKEPSTIWFYLAGDPTLNDSFLLWIWGNRHLLSFTGGDKIPDLEREINLPIALSSHWVRGLACKRGDCETTQEKCLFEIHFWMKKKGLDTLNLNT